MSDVLSVVGQLLCIFLITVFVVPSIVFIRDARRPVEEWAYTPEAFFTSISEDERERPQTMATCAFFCLVVVVILVIIGIAVF